MSRWAPTPVPATVGATRIAGPRKAVQRVRLGKGLDRYAFRCGQRQRRTGIWRSHGVAGARRLTRRRCSSDIRETSWYPRGARRWSATRDCASGKRPPPASGIRLSGSPPPGAPALRPCTLSQAIASVASACTAMTELWDAHTAAEVIQDHPGSKSGELIRRDRSTESCMAMNSGLLWCSQQCWLGLSPLCPCH
jgi:hypothetical protein